MNASSGQTPVDTVGQNLAFGPSANPKQVAIEEMIFSERKALLRQAAVRTVGELWLVVADCLVVFMPTNAKTTSKPQTMNPGKSNKMQVENVGVRLRV